MHIQCDTLKYAKLLNKKGVGAETAESWISTLTAIEIFNLYSKCEVDNMLSEAVKKVFIEQRREFDARMKDIISHHEAQRREQRTELLASRRWMIGTVITVGLSVMAVLLTALFQVLQLNH